MLQPPSLFNEWRLEEGGNTEAGREFPRVPQKGGERLTVLVNSCIREVDRIVVKD